MTRVFTLFAGLIFLFNQQVMANDLCESLAVTSPRGISCLHCLDSRSEVSASKLVSAIQKSCIKNTALAFALDGSFGTNYSRITRFANELNQDGRSLSVHLYFLNGPTNRRADVGLYKGFANNIPPPKLRAAIQSDKKFQNELKIFIKQFIPIIRGLLRNGVNLYLSPMLEDNLDNRSFNTLSRLIKEALPKGLKVRWIRSPCPDCYPGNQSGKPQGFGEEDHRSTLPLRSGTKIYSNDGWGFVYFSKEELPSQKLIEFWGKKQQALYLDDLYPILNATNNSGQIFLLWLSKYQGTLMGRAQIPVSERNLLIPSDEELDEISSFLRR